MIPTIEEYQQGATTWRFKHKGIDYKVSHHGVSDYRHSGTWCYYVFFNQLMFQNEDDWKLFDLDVQVKEYMDGQFMERFPYEDIPEMDWHCGATYGVKHSNINKFTGERYSILEIGCDFSHLYDEGREHCYNLESLKGEAEILIEEFVRTFPQNAACAWSGIIANPSEFYIAANGATVHKSYKNKLDHENWKEVKNSY